MKFFATIEFLLSQRAAIIALTDSTGEFAGAGRIDLRPRAFETHEAFKARLYETGYTYASRVAIGKGGRLERFSVIHV